MSCLLRSPLLGGGKEMVRDPGDAASPSGPCLVRFLDSISLLGLGSRLQAEEQSLGLGWAAGTETGKQKCPVPGKLLQS